MDAPDLSFPTAGLVPVFSSVYMPDAAQGRPSGIEEAMGASLEIAWDRDRLMVTSEAALAKINRPALSFSTHKAIHGCPSRMVADKLMPEGFNVFAANNLGTSAHTVLENLYQLPSAIRTRDTVSMLVADLARVTDFEKQAAIHGGDPGSLHDEWVSEISIRSHGIFAIEDPTKVQVRRTEWLLDGIRIGGVPFKGFIDRVDMDPDGGSVVKDYKAGASKIKDDRALARFGDDHGDQIRIYAAAAREFDGVLPTSGQILYTYHGVAREVSLTESRVDAVVEDFAESWELLHGMVAQSAFPAVSSVLCGWCPLVLCCPVAKRDGLDNPRALQDETHIPQIPVIAPLAVEELVQWPEYAPPPAPVDEMPEWPVFETAEEPAGDSYGDRSYAGEPAETIDDDAREAQPMTGMISEDKAFVLLSNEGKLNPNSYGAQAVFEVAQLSLDVLTAAGQPVNQEAVDALAKTFAVILASAQEAITGSTSWQDGANARLRGVLARSVQLSPVPFGGSGEELDNWVRTTRSRVLAVASAAYRLFDDNRKPVGRPWAQFDPAPAQDAFAGA